MRVLNRRNLKKPWPRGAVYVGRGTPLGNPYRITKKRSREEAINKYRGWLRERIHAKDKRVLAALERLNRDSKLVCWCAPEPCHADVIIEVWEELFGE